jgi:hypothetical protein
MGDRLCPMPQRHVKLYKSGTAPSTGLHNRDLAPTDLPLGDLISFFGGTGEKDGERPYGGSDKSQENKVTSFEGDLMELLYTPQGSHTKIDGMIEANLSDFSSQEECRSLTVNSYGVSRRLRGDSKVNSK